MTDDEAAAVATTSDDEDTVAAGDGESDRCEYMDPRRHLPESLSHYFDATRCDDDSDHEDNYDSYESDDNSYFNEDETDTDEERFDNEERYVHVNPGNPCTYNVGTSSYSPLDFEHNKAMKYAAILTKLYRETGGYLPYKSVSHMLATSVLPLTTVVAVLARVPVTGFRAMCEPFVARRPIERVLRNLLIRYRTESTVFAATPISALDITSTIGHVWLVQSNRIFYGRLLHRLVRLPHVKREPVSKDLYSDSVRAHNTRSVLEILLARVVNDVCSYDGTFCQFAADDFGTTSDYVSQKFVRLRRYAVVCDYWLLAIVLDYLSPADETISNRDEYREYSARLLSRHPDDVASSITTTAVTRTFDTFVDMTLRAIASVDEPRRNGRRKRSAAGNRKKRKDR